MDRKEQVCIARAVFEAWFDCEYAFEPTRLTRKRKCVSLDGVNFSLGLGFTFGNNENTSELLPDLRVIIIPEHKQSEIEIRSFIAMNLLATGIAVEEQEKQQEDDEELKQKVANTEPNDTFDTLLLHIAETCIKNNWFRTSEPFDKCYHCFTPDELNVFNKILDCSDECALDGGYCFLDEDGGTEGMIRLYANDCNPKWSFGKKEGELWVDHA